MTATCSFARGPVNSAFHEAVKISFLMSDIRSLSTYLTCPAWRGWLGLAGSSWMMNLFIFQPPPGATQRGLTFLQISTIIHRPPPRTPSLVISGIKLARLVRHQTAVSRRNSPDNSSSGSCRGADIKSGELERETAPPPL